MAEHRMHVISELVKSRNMDNRRRQWCRLAYYGRDSMLKSMFDMIVWSVSACIGVSVEPKYWNPGPACST